MNINLNSRSSRNIHILSIIYPLILGDDWAHYSLPLIVNTPILCHMWFHLLLFAVVSAGVLNDGITDFYISVSYCWLGIFHESPENPYYIPLNLLKITINSHQILENPYQIRPKSWHHNFIISQKIDPSKAQETCPQSGRGQSLSIQATHTQQIKGVRQQRTFDLFVQGRFCLRCDDCHEMWAMCHWDVSLMCRDHMGFSSMSFPGNLIEIGEIMPFTDICRTIMSVLGRHFLWMP